MWGNLRICCEQGQTVGSWGPQAENKPIIQRTERGREELALHQRPEFQPQQTPAWGLGALVSPKQPNQNSGSEQHFWGAGEAPSGAKARRWPELWRKREER